VNLRKSISDFGPAQRTQCIAQQLTCHCTFSPAATFETIAPNFQNDPTALQATFQSINNQTFPAIIDDQYIETLKSESQIILEGNIRLPLGYKEQW